MKRPKYRQGFFKAKNPQKYVGDPNMIIFRSGLEMKYYKYFDESPSIIRWGSEEFFIPYISPLDGKRHRYFPDIFIEANDKQGQRIKFIIEIKPQAFCYQPRIPKVKTKAYVWTLKNWLVNSAKWDAARIVAAKSNCKFVILTEQSFKPV